MNDEGALACTLMLGVVLGLLLGYFGVLKTDNILIHQIGYCRVVDSSSTEKLIPCPK